MDNLTIFTIGHSTHGFAEFAKMLNAYDVDMVIDVRTIPGSRANPQFNAENLEKELKSQNILYKHMAGLGGLRKATKDSVNTYWKNASFRGFADYMQTNAFKESVDELIEIAKKKRVALMCAEAVPWRCHRSLIADALVARGIKVIHIFSPTYSSPHQLNKNAVVDGLSIMYK